MESKLLSFMVVASLLSADLGALGDMCSELHQKYNPEKRVFYRKGEILPIVVNSTERAPSRATAALLAAGLRHGYGYDVIVDVNNRTVGQLVDEIKPLDEDKRILVYIDADADDTCNRVVFRLQPVGFAAALNVKWHIKLAKNLTREEWREINFWNFYSNPNSLQECGFNTGKLLVWVPSDIKAINEYKLNKTTEGLHHNTHSLEWQYIDRKALTIKTQIETTSFLFVDFDMWRDNLLIQVIEDAPEVASYTAVSLRLADVKMFPQYAPLLMKAINSFAPRANVLREIIEIQSNNMTYEEAACAWATNHAPEFESWTTNFAKTFTNIIVYLVCNHTPNAETYKNYVDLIDKANLAWDHDNFELHSSIINCNDENSVLVFLDKLSRNMLLANVAGVLAPGMGAITAAREKAAREKIPLIYYDITPKTELEPVISSTGSLDTLAKAIRHFFAQHQWKRIAVVSEDTSVAKDFFAELKQDKHLIVQNFKIHGQSDVSVQTIVRNLKQVNARIIFLNANSELSNRVACEASKLGMTPDEGFAWIAREWSWYDSCEDPVPVYSLSYGWRGGNISLVNITKGGNEQLQSALNDYWGNSTWLHLTVPLIDSIVMMTNTLKAVFKSHPEIRFDLHSQNITRIFEKELYKTSSLKGVMQELRLEDGAIKDPLITVSSWHNDANEILALWRTLGSDIKEEVILRKPYQDSLPPHDGRPRCYLHQTGDPFSPGCLDLMWAAMFLVILFSTIAFLIWAWKRKKEAEKREKLINELLLELTRVSRHPSQMPNPPMRLVERSSIELYEELGSGHFGLVSSGVIRDPDREPEFVAVKALRKHPGQSEEEEFLQEARALASLSHQHIVRLVGVCTGDGNPPLLLMEYCFFGDLLHYLRARHYLFSEGFAENEQMQHWDRAEARHVSSRELTRLAREAATALVYLEKKKLVHRDLRAANCLIDASRTLKVADFGLARWLNKNEPSVWPEVPESDYKYILRRPAVFPARWTAPESIRDGEFSYASDVWALGVMILEIVTLGAPPYGDWSDARVLRYVRGGGKPPVPRDAHMHTYMVTDICWNPDPALRANAYNVKNFLNMHPDALRPAYREPDFTAFPKMDKRFQNDSGFVDRELPTDWPLPRDPCISTWT